MSNINSIMKYIPTLLLGVFIVLFISKKNKTTNINNTNIDKNVLIIQRCWKTYLKSKESKIQDKIQRIKLQKLLDKKIINFILKRVLITWKEYTIHQRNIKMKKTLLECDDDYFFINI